MNFKTNFNKITLLGNQIIRIYFDDKTIEFVPPNLKLYLTNYDFMELIYMLKLTPSDLVKIFPIQNFIVENNYETFISIIKNYKTDEFLNYFNQIFPNIEYKNSHFECGGIPLNSEEYDLLLEFLFVSCGERDFSSLMQKIDLSYKKEELTELQKRKLEQDKKVQELKNKKKNKDKKDSSITIDQIVIAILYEFPSLSLEDIYNMNMVTLLDLWSYIAKIVDNQIQIVAAGNGLIKEFTYFIH